MPAAAFMQVQEIILPPEVQGTLKACRKPMLSRVLPVSQQDIQLEKTTETQFKIGLVLNSNHALTDRNRVL